MLQALLYALSFHKLSRGIWAPRNEAGESAKIISKHFIDINAPQSLCAIGQYHHPYFTSGETESGEG